MISLISLILMELGLLQDCIPKLESTFTSKHMLSCFSYHQLNMSSVAVRHHPTTPCGPDTLSSSISILIFQTTLAVQHSSCLQKPWEWWTLPLWNQFKERYFVSVSSYFLKRKYCKDFEQGWFSWCKCAAHGDTQGSLLHEGSAVGAGGGKLVIRTELLFEAQGFGQFKPPTNGNVTAQSWEIVHTGFTSGIVS